MTTSATANYPFFVYGTLRPVEPNYRRLLADVTSHECGATLGEATMFAGQGFPYVSPGGAGAVIGDLIWVTDRHYRPTLSRLDQLEGYRGAGVDNHYDRVLTEVVTSTGEPVTAWVYLAGSRARLNRRRRIESGDWLADAFAPTTS